jgi:hypothetical protein
MLLGLPGRADALQTGELPWLWPADHYKWLWNSPWRPYLSSGAEFYLQLRFGDRVQLPGQEGEKDNIFGLNVRVNDRAQDENPSLTTQSETAVATFGSNVVVGWNDVGQFFQTASLTGYGYSTDGGRTFTDGGVIPPPPGGANLGDPDVAVDSRGTFYFSQISIDADGVAFIGVAKSTDGGRTFSRPVSASWSVSGPDSFQDKEFITADGTGGPFDGNVYVSWTRFSSQGSQIMFARSSDGGRSFERAIALSPPGHFVQGSIPRVGPNGEVYVAWRDFNTPGIFVSKSTDGGRTFGADGVSNVQAAGIEFIGQDAPRATCQGRRILNGYIDAGFEFPSMAVSPGNGEVYIVYNSNPPGVDQADVYFVRSSDGGRSWSEPVRLNDDRTTSDQFMPAVAVAEDGTVAAIWYDRRNDSKNLKMDIYMARSHDGGRTWLPNERVTTTMFDVPPLGPNFDVVRPCYMGDYIDIAADAQNFYLIWGDNRNPGLTWKTLPDMPTPREATANAAVGRAVFVIGGTKLGFREVGDSDVNEAFNTRTGHWFSLAPMPTPRSEAVAVSYGLSVYVLGGQSSKYGGVSGAFERFDVLGNRWVSLPPLPTPRTALGAVRLRSKIYAIGGQDCVSLFCGHTLDVVEIYDLATGRWTTGTPLPEPRAAFATAVIDGKIYVIGGYNAQTGEVYKSVLAYDPRTAEWTWETDLPNGRIAPIVGVCGDKLIVTGGLSRTFSVIRRSAWNYDILTGRWQRVAAPKFARFGVSAVNVKGALYAIGGSSSSRVRHSGAGEAFDCSRLGFTRPDPDVFFAVRPVRPFGSDLGPAADGISRGSISESETPELRVEARRAPQARAWVFRIDGDEADIESVRLQIYDLRGALVFDTGRRRGPTIQWNLETSGGAPAANGVYLYVITVRNKTGGIVRSPVRLIAVTR